MSGVGKSYLDSSAVITTAATTVPIIGTTSANATLANAIYKLNSIIFKNSVSFVPHAVPSVMSGWGPAVVMPVDT